MRRSLALWLLACSAIAAAAQQTPTPTELGGKPFFVTKTWTIGGEGNWDNLTVDARAGQLFIAHGPVVQVVDVETAALVGKIGGLGNARSIALDDTGEFGFIADDRTGAVVVFDRRTLGVSARIPTGSNPQVLVFDPVDKLLFAISASASLSRPTRMVRSRDADGKPNIVFLPDPSHARADEQKYASRVAVIDTQTMTVLGEMLFSGRLAAAQCDALGRLYTAVVDRNYVLRIDSQDAAKQLRSQAHDGSSILDWSDIATGIKGYPVFFWTAPNHPDIHYLDPACGELKTLALENAHDRLFAACGNGKVVVLNADNGSQIAALSITGSADALAFDADRNLLYAANGNGMLSIVREHVTDSYSVIQELPTRQQARTLAVNPVNGEVYLVTNLQGVDVSKPGGIGTLKAVPVPGSFQVLVVGN